MNWERIDGLQRAGTQLRRILQSLPYRGAPNRKGRNRLALSNRGTNAGVPAIETLARAAAFKIDSPGWMLKCAPIPRVIRLPISSSGSAIGIFEANNIVLTEVAFGLDLDDLEGNRARVRQTVRFAKLKAVPVTTIECSV
jgi:hypothetical protein